MSPAGLILWPLAVLLGGMLAELLLARTLSPRGKGWLALAAALAALVGVLAAYPAIWTGQTLEVNLAHWNGPAALAYHVDGLSLLFALMAAGIGAVVLLYSVAYMERERGATRFYALMLVFIAGLIQLVYSADWILLYLSWETVGLCSFLLVGFWYQQKEAAAGARKVLVMTHLAGYGLLAAILLLYARTGSTLWTDPRVAGAFSTGVFGLMLLAALAKSVQFPLHTWIPDAMAAPTPVSALLHAACYVKAGVYLLARMHSLGAWQTEWQTTVIWIGTITMLVGVLYALIQTDLKRLLAFHTVSQIGYMVLGLGLGTPLGIAAALLHCLNHALFKGGLFLCAGAVEHGAGTRDLDRLGGLARRMPRTATFWLILAGSIAGVPLLSGFVSKWLLFNAAMQVGQPLPALASWIVSVLTVFSFLKATGGTFLGNQTPEAARAHDSPRPMLLGAGLLAAGSIVLGVAPQLAVQYLINPLLPALGASGVVGVTWLGLTTASGSWYASGGLVLAGVSVGAGALVLYLTRTPLATGARGAVAAAAAGGGVFTGGEPLTGAGRLPPSDFSLYVKHGLAPFYEWANVDRYYRGLWRGLLRVCEQFERLGRVLERNAIPAMISLTLLVFALALAWTPRFDPRSISAVAPPLDVSTPLLVAAAVSLFALLAAVAVVPHTERTLRVMAGAGLLVVLGLAVESQVLRLGALEAADLLALALVWQTARQRRAVHAYLLAVVLSALALAAGMATLNVAPEIAPALLLTAFALKLALVPVYLWLPAVAETWRVASTPNSSPPRPRRNSRARPTLNSMNSTLWKSPGTLCAPPSRISASGNRGRSTSRIPRPRDWRGSASKR